MNKGEAYRMASAALSIDPDVIGGIECLIVHGCFTRSSIPQSIGDLAISGICLVVLRAVRTAFVYILFIVGGVRRIIVSTTLVLIQTNLIHQ